MIRSAIEHGGLDQLDAITAAIHQTGALDYTEQQAQHFASQAKQALAALPRSRYVDALEFIADYSVARKT